MNNLKIYVDTWIIQDGNYKDFAKGDKRKFAIEFHGKLKKSKSAEKYCRPTEHACQYQVNAEVVYVYSEMRPHEIVSRKNGKRVSRKEDREVGVAVLDLGGVMVYDEPHHGERKYKQGSFVEGTVNLAIDYFAYKESLCKYPGIPDLMYNWRITKVEKDTTPYILTERQGGGKLYTPDTSKVSYQEVKKSDAWDDMPPFGGYVLTIEKKI